MKLIIGLGNPEEQYKNNRHNVGFMVLNKIASERNLIWEESKKGKLEHSWFVNKNGKVELIKPLTFMNKSGYSVSYAKNKHKVDFKDIFVVHDDLDIILGNYKIQLGRGPRDHNGINDIQEKLGTDNFWYVRVGVDNRDPNKRTMGEKYVLEDFTIEEKIILGKVIDEICKKLVII